MIALFRIAAVALLLLVPALALGQGKGLTGTWKAVVLKKKDEKVSLTKDGFSLLIAIDDQAKTWQATAKTASGEQKSEGTYTVDDQHVVFAEKNGRQHALRAHVEGNQLILSPKDDPDTRLVALRVQ
jgi:hypothetical protein